MELPKAMSRSSVAKLLSTVKQNDLVIVYWIDSGAHGLPNCSIDYLHIGCSLSAGFFHSMENDQIKIAGNIDTEPDDVECYPRSEAIWLSSIVNVWAVTDNQRWLKHIQSGAGNNE